MCGICGVYRFDQQPVHATLVEEMVATIDHRGPDDHGVWTNANVGLANARLAILDLSAAGHQPMADSEKSVWLAYNGEIYNFKELRKQLAADIRWQSETDTETIIQAYRTWGIDCLHRFNGMFGFALWDTNAEHLLLVRDRLGQKPLYYYQDAEKLIFGSEIKCILAHPNVDTGVNTEVIPSFFTYGYVPAPETMFRNINMLLPGHFLKIAPDHSVSIQQWWTPPANTNETVRPADIDLDAQEAALEQQLRQAVEYRMISDVPVGAFLSGGIDSSLIVALMRDYSSEKIKTFAIGFEDNQSYDETPYAKEVAEHLGAEHRTFIVAPDTVDLIESLAWHLDQPFGDSSAIPTYLVSKHTREHVTVALTGDGGDELFAGYDRFRAARIAKQYQKVPQIAHRLIQGGLGLLPQGTGYRNFARRATEFTETARLSLSDQYLGWVGICSPEFAAQLSKQNTASDIRQHYASYFPTVTHDPVPALLDVNRVSYLPDDLLIKADRMSMATSLEARSPFLDHNLVEFAAHLPMVYKLQGRDSKLLLRRLAKRFVPAHIIDRPKHGFGVPIGQWFRQSLRSYVEAELTGADAKNKNYLEVTMVQSILAEHMSGKRDHGHLLWCLLSFEVWLKKLSA